MERILIVEDDPQLIRVLELQLQHYGYETRAANDGGRAEAVFAAANFDLIVLDVMLPGMNGFEHCRRIRTQSAVPIIMLTAKVEVTDKIIGLDFGADDYVTKPFAMEELGDYTLLLQMLRAVSENSVKYTVENGRIDIKAYPEKDRIVIEISDNGIGIPESDLEKVFERFYRVDPSRDRTKGGTGLGLALARQVAALHSGAVEAESRTGRGTTLRFRLPLIRE